MSTSDFVFGTGRILYTLLVQRMKSEVDIEWTKRLVKVIILPPQSMMSVWTIRVPSWWLSALKTEEVLDS